MTDSRDVLIIGAGPVGLFTIFQAGMLGMSCSIIDSRNEIGGQCSALYPEKPIYDIPAYPKITGAELTEQLANQASPFNPIYHLGDEAIGLKQFGDYFEVTTAKNVVIRSKIIVIAAGAGSFMHKKPPLRDIELFEGKSVFYSVNSRSDFINKNIVIAGGGDSAIDWAISLAEIAKKIFLVHRRDVFKASPEGLKQVAQLQQLRKLELVTHCQLDALNGKDGILESVVVKSLDGNVRRLEADILLPFFGLIQNIGSLSEWGLQLKSNNVVVTNPYYETNIPAIYAVGDIATYDGKLKLILTGFAEVASSLHHAYGRIFEGKALHFQYSTSKGVKQT